MNHIRTHDNIQYTVHLDVEVVQAKIDNAPSRAANPGRKVVIL